MNPQGTSFIPQRPATQNLKNKGVRKIYALTYISYVLFFGAVLSAVGLFLFNSVLSSQLQAIQDKLIAEEEKFDQGAIAEIYALDTQIKTADTRMNLHLSVLPIFKELEEYLSQNLTLTGFSYLRENDAAPKIDVTGETTVVNSLLFQRELLDSSLVLKGSEFTQVSVTSAGDIAGEMDNLSDSASKTKVAFWLGKTMSPELIPYTPIQFETEVIESSEEAVTTAETGVSEESVSFTEEPN